MDVVSFYCWSLMIVAGWLTALLSEDSHILLRAVTVINLWKQSTIFRYPVFLHVSFGFSCCRRLVSISVPQPDDCFVGRVVEQFLFRC